MSKGMWTKHLDADGRGYFFNAALNKSLWYPPSDGIVHEALFIYHINDIEAVHQPQLSTPFIHGEQSLITPTTISPPINHDTIQINSVPCASASQTSKNDTMATELQAKIDMLLQQQREMAAQKKHKKNEATTEETKSLSMYMQQKSELEELAGSKNRDGAKWFVR